MVEDDPFQLQVLFELMRDQLELECDVASNGQMGLNKYSQRLKTYRNYLENSYNKLYSLVNPDK